MLFSTAVWIKIGLSALISFLIALATTPIVKMFAEQVGAIDVPTEARRVHDHPIPRMGGLSIFYGFVVSMLCFGTLDRQLSSILIGANLQKPSARASTLSGSTDIPQSAS